MEAMKITVSELLWPTATHQWNIQTNGNWGTKTKGLCRSVWRVISEGEGLSCSN